MENLDVEFYKILNEVEKENGTKINKKIIPFLKELFMREYRKESI